MRAQGKHAHPRSAESLHSSQRSGPNKAPFPDRTQIERSPREPVAEARDHGETDIHGWSRKRGANLVKPAGGPAMACILRPGRTEQPPPIAAGETLHAIGWDLERAGRNPLAKRRLPRSEEEARANAAVRWDLQTAFLGRPRGPGQPIPREAGGEDRSRCRPGFSNSATPAGHTWPRARIMAEPKRIARERRSSSSRTTK